jgi:hypothetical protein
MKDIELKTDEKIELRIQKRQEKTKYLDGVLFPHKGHTIWQINEETLEITPAEFSKEAVFVFGKENRPEIIKVPGCVYVAALNKKTALEKYKKGENGSIKVIAEPLKLIKF